MVLRDVVCEVERSHWKLSLNRVSEYFLHNADCVITRVMLTAFRKISTDSWSSIQFQKMPSSLLTLKKNPQSLHSFYIIDCKRSTEPLVLTWCLCVSVNLHNSYWQNQWLNVAERLIYQVLCCATDFRAISQINVLVLSCNTTLMISDYNLQWPAVSILPNTATTSSSNNILLCSRFGL